MTNEFIMRTRQPTPEELLGCLVALTPGFADMWRDSLFIKDDGSFTVHGVFSEYSTYIRAHYTEIKSATWRALFRYVEQCVVIDPHSASGVGNAACTCFLENIAGEGELSGIVLPYLGPESRKYFDEWNH